MKPGFKQCVNSGSSVKPLEVILFQIGRYVQLRYLFKLLTPGDERRDPRPDVNFLLSDSTSKFGFNKLHIKLLFHWKNSVFAKRS